MEPPIIDLSAPAPPASPSEDPILLSGPSKQTTQLANSSGISASPPTVANDEQGGWSDSDELSVDEDGEFTGRFRAYVVPVKADPPSPGTKDRIERWGRPVSPHPTYFPFDDLGGSPPRPQNPLTEDFLSRMQSNDETQSELSGDDFADEELPGPGLVQITSQDPKVAARAAAILKKHDFDLVSNRFLSPQISEPDRLRGFRRKGLLRSGVCKSPSLRNRILNPRHLPNLLNEAESQLDKELSPFRSQSLPAFSTPGPSRLQPFERASVGPQQWTTDDWKALDSCFTDERLSMESENDVDVSQVDLHRVVTRYISLVGGEQVLLTLGEEWTLEKILQRARTLRKRQEIGNGGPPTPLRVPLPRFSTPSTPLSRPISVVKRSLSYLSSWVLPNSFHQPPPKPSAAFRPTLLPLPSPSVLNKPRGPIATPVRVPGSPVKHPKELVHLNHVPELPRQAPPTPPPPPIRLVQLNHVSPLPPAPPARLQRQRSQGSVKDLVQSFEELSETSASESGKRRRVARMNSATHSCP